jgi:type I restriction enzyme R subunit
MKHKNLAFELLKKLINNQIKSLTKKNLIKSRSFLEMLEATIKKYQNRNIESAEVIAELVELAKKIKNEQEK